MCWPIATLDRVSYAVVEGTASVQIGHMRTENLTNPLGIDATTPHLSWQMQAMSLDARGLKQTAYRVLATSSQALLAQEKGDPWNLGK